MSSRFKYGVVSASTLLALVLVAGSVAGQTAEQPDTLKHIGVFSDVVSKIKSDYVEEPDMKSVTLGALNGMLEAIDPFASYLNADQYRDYLKNKDAKRADAGLILSKKYGYLGVVGVWPNSPAATAGLQCGDMVESIAGVATRDMPLAYAALLLRGDAGSTVDLSLVRVRKQEPETVKLTRAVLVPQAVEARIVSTDVGYLNIDAITQNTLAETSAAVSKLEKEGAHKLVVDVRNCAVGTPEQGIALANLFLKQGRITYMQGQTVPRKDFDADPAKAITTLPMAVVVNRGTAEGAEILASAIQDNKRGSVVGEITYGNAALRRPVMMEDGGAIILSVAKYYSADGKAIQDNRVTPATQVTGDEAQNDDDADLAPGQEPPAPRKAEDDAAVKKAIELLGK